MTWLRAARKALFGETWVLPIGVALVIAGAALIEALAPKAFDSLGGPLLAAGVIGVLLIAVAGEARALD
jgi:hypothetical protein